MTTSLQLAQECLREGLPEPSEPPQPLEGLEMFAQTIETGEQAPARPIGHGPLTVTLWPRCETTLWLCHLIRDTPPTPQCCGGSR